MLALATVAPAAHREWTIDDAHLDFSNLLQALAGANVRETAERLDVRWNQCCGLQRLLEEARRIAKNSCAMRFERMRTEWQREAARHGRSRQGR